MSENKYHTDEALIIIDQKFKIIDVNENAINLFNSNYESLINTAFTSLLEKESVKVLSTEEIFTLPIGKLNALNSLIIVSKYRKNIICTVIKLEHDTFLLVMNDISKESGVDYLDMQHKIKALQESVNNANRRLKFLGGYDPLTELPNRTLFFDKLKIITDNINRYEGSCVMFLIYVNGFNQQEKEIDADEKDFVLREVAKKFTLIFRASDIVARFSDSEFAVIMNHISERQDCDSVIKKLLQLFKEEIISAKARYRVKINIGIVFYPQDAKDVNVLMDHAQEALAIAKKAGVDKFHFYKA